MQTSIVVKLTVLGLHYWPRAAEVMPEVSYLANLHNHHFQITCKKRVTEDDRQIELIQFRLQIENFLKKKFYDEKYNCCNFKSMSCEHICKYLQKAFDLDFVSVWEDNEIGAELETWTPYMEVELMETRTNQE